MTKLDKQISQMKQNPQANWRIEDIKRIAARYNVDWHQRSSPVVFRSPSGEHLTVPVPAHRPIKSVYIRQFLALIEEVIK